MVRLRKGKGKKWRKGQSCESNPQSRAYRDAARRGTFRPRADTSRGASNLTMDAVARHDNVHDSDGDVDIQEGDAQSVQSGKTFGTSFSVGGLTDCCNPVFSSVRRFWDSPLAHHKEVCAVLAAVTEVIKSEGGSESDIEYFAAFMTTLESSKDEDAVSAIAFLLSLVMKSVPETVLRAKFSKSCQVLLNILGVHAAEGGTSLLKSLLACIYHLLRVQESAVWTESSTMKTYHGLLSFTVHSKPKVRKCAVECVGKLLKTVPEKMSVHPTASSTAKFCVQQIEKHGGASQAVTTLHVLGLLREVLPLFPLQNVKTSCECLLKLMTLGNVMVTVNSLQVLHHMFDSAGQASLNAELNAQIVNALYEYQPSSNDMQLSKAWLATMEKAYTSLARVDSGLCLAHLPRFFRSSINLVSSGDDLGAVISAAMKELLTCCVKPIAETVAEEADKKSEGHSVVHQLAGCMEEGLKYRYHAAWGHILSVIETFFEVLGKYYPQVMKKLLVSICDLRGTFQFPFIRQLDRAVGVAVQKMGPRRVLDAVPLKLEKESPTCDFPRSWLLPVMKESIRDTELKYFFSTMLPLAAKLRSKAEKLKDSGQELESKVYDTLQLQIWSLLPGFCTRPNDICESFKSVARILGVALTERPDLCLIVCHALRLLVSKSTDNEENKRELSKYAKNYLPILFNLYTSEPKDGDPDKLPILETIRTYLTITDEKLVEGFFNKAVEKTNKEDSSLYTRNAVLDLVIAMIPYVGESCLQTLFGMAVPWLQKTDLTRQKKAYRILEQICCTKSEACSNFIGGHLDQLKEILLKNVSSANSASKAPRLRCLAHMVNQLGEDHISFIQAIIPEVILCTKEVSVKARTGALSALVEACNALIRCSGESEKDCLTSYIGLVLAGLAGSPHMISATIISISRLVYEFRGKIPSGVLEQLLSGIMVCLGSTSRDVVKSAIGFLKVMISTMSIVDLASHVQELVNGLVNWNEDSRKKFRFKARVILERLIRKFGYNMIYKCVPEKHRKLIVHVHKTTQRLKRQSKAKKVERMQAKEEDANAAAVQSYEDLMFGSDSEDEETKPSKSRKTKKGEQRAKQGRNSKTWIQEGADDEPVDFLDTKVVQRITATDPTKSNKRVRKETAGFEIASDGRLIIPDEDEKDKVSPGSKRKRKQDLYDEDEPMELSSESGVKRKRKAYQGVDDEDKKEGGLIEKKTVTKHQFGAEYKAKKAGGDIKKKGKPDPFAYVPLNLQSLNKRKQRKMAGQFKGLVRATRRGALTTKHKRPKK